MATATPRHLSQMNVTLIKTDLDSLRSDHQRSKNIGFAVNHPPPFHARSFFPTVLANAPKPEMVLQCFSNT